MDEQDRGWVNHPDELKWTPNTAMEMRFGPGGEARPHREAPKATDKPVQVRKFKPKNKTEIAFNLAFWAVAFFMVLGASGALLLNTGMISVGGADEPVPQEVATDAPAEESEELQGGVKVRKGLGQ